MIRRPPRSTLFPYTTLFRSPNVLVVPASLPIRSFAEFIAYAKKHPGQLNYGSGGTGSIDRKSTRLNSSHLVISYAVFCLKKKKQIARSCAGKYCNMHLHRQL